MKFSRRSLLGAAAAGAASLAAGSGDMRRVFGRQEARNVIFVVVDGMAIQTMSMWDQYSRMVHGNPSYWSELMGADDVTNGLQETRSLNSVVTDSSAASSAWGSGSRIWNNAVNMLPDGTEMTPICPLMAEAGVKCGLVTTTRITHATPAGFASVSVNRGDEDSIAAQYLGGSLDVLLGGGSGNFDASRRRDGLDLFGSFERSGFNVVRDRDALMGIGGPKVLGLFYGSHLPYTVDRDNQPELARTVPTLAEMSSKAIEILNQSSNGFLLQIEGGKVDHGAHGNDLAGMLFDQREFEAALKVAIDFAREDGDTLVIATADHACGGPSLNGDGPDYGLADGGLALAAGMKASYDELLPALAETSSAGEMQDVVDSLLGIQLSPEEATAVFAAKDGNSPFALSPFADRIGHTLAEVLGNYTKVTWTSGNHTSDHVLVTALGPGSEAVAGLTPNTNFFDLMLAAKGLRHSNPKMSYEEARQFIDAANPPASAMHD